MESPQPACYGVQVLVTSDRRGLPCSLPQALLGACDGLFVVAALIARRITTPVIVAAPVAWITVATTADPVAAAVSVVTVQEPVSQDFSQDTRPFSFYYYCPFSYRVMSSCGACHQ